MPTRFLSLRTLVLGGLLAVAGCATTRTDTFDIEVHNQTGQALTLSLAKDGPPYEPTWATAQDLAIESPRRREEWKNAVSGIMGPLEQGKTAYVLKLRGKFDSNTRAFLRVYAGGELTVSQILSRGVGSPDRVDVPLKPGKNNITITTEASHLKADVAADAPGK